MHRFLAALALALALSIASPTMARADTSGAVVTDDEGADATASSESSTPGSSDSSSEDCEYRLLDIDDDLPVYDVHGNEIEVDGTGDWYEKWCDGVFHGAVYISRIGPDDLLAEARRRLNLPLPDPHLSPDGEQLVNLATWLWIDRAEWTTRSATASVPGLAVTVTAIPESVTWRLGDEAPAICGPGVAYDPSTPIADQHTDCSLTFTRSSAGQRDQRFEAAVTVTWIISWEVIGAAGGGDLGRIDRTTRFEVAVAEVQALNVNSESR